MFCPKCGTNNPDNAVFCKNCGTPFDRYRQPIAPPVPQQPDHHIAPPPQPVAEPDESPAVPDVDPPVDSDAPGYDPDPIDQNQKPKSHKGIIIAIIAFLVLLAIGAAGWYFDARRLLNFFSSERNESIYATIEEHDDHHETADPAYASLTIDSPDVVEIETDTPDPAYPETSDDGWFLNTIRLNSPAARNGNIFIYYLKGDFIYKSANYPVGFACLVQDGEIQKIYYKNMKYTTLIPMSFSYTPDGDFQLKSLDNSTPLTVTFHDHHNYFLAGEASSGNMVMGVSLGVTSETFDIPEYKAS